MNCPIVSKGSQPAGLTLLEVLVSCGILAIGLASVAALLPAAGSRFAQATQADRAGALAASVRAELANRGIVAADVVTGTIPGAAPANPPHFALGQVLTALNTVSSTARLWPTVSSTIASPVFARRLDTTATGRDLLLDDDLIYTSTSAGPVNTFAADGGRAFNAGLLWGATLIPLASPSVPVTGMPATLSVAVFRKAGVAREILLSADGACVGVVVSSTVQRSVVDIDAARRLVLQPCSSVLVLTNPPRWARVASSWKTGTSGTSGASFALLDPNPIASGTGRVVGFEGLLRVDHYPVTLD